MEHHLWRSYRSAPFYRYALTAKAADTPDGYVVIDHDPAVADGPFMAAFATSMQQPVVTGVSVDVGPDMIVDGHKVLHPGDPGYFDNAIRSVPDAVLRSAGRS